MTLALNGRERERERERQRQIYGDMIICIMRKFFP